SPDGKTLVAHAYHMGLDANRMGIDTKVLRWEVASGKLLGSFAAPKGPLHAPVFSPDGRILVFAGSDGTIRGRDLALGQEIFKVEPSAPPAYRLAIAPDGKSLVSLGGGNRIQLWDIATSRELLSRNAPGEKIASMVYSSSGKFVALASGNGVY